MRVDGEARTTMAVIALVDEHNAEFIFYRNPGADQRLQPDELDVNLLSTTRALHFGSLSLTDEPSRSATYEAVRVAARTGALISFDVNYRPSLWSSSDQAVEQIKAMIPHVHLLKVNEIEIKLLTRGWKPEAEIQKRIGSPEPIQVYPWARAYKMALEEENVVLFGMTYTQDRSELFKWVGPLATKRDILLARKDAPASITSLPERTVRPRANSYDPAGSVTVAPEAFAMVHDLPTC